VAGGSGGHITPALQLGKQWKEKNPNGFILFFGNQKKLDRQLLTKNNLLPPNSFKIIWLKLNPISLRKPVFVPQLIISFFKSLFFLYKYKPEKIISTGGAIALPTTLAGWLLRIPIELHELNVVPGKAIRVLSPLAQTIFVTFPKSKRWFKKKNCALEPYPLRFSHNSTVHTKESLIKKINSTITTSDHALTFSPTKKTLFLLGGSQGSLFLNNLLKQWIQNQKNFMEHVQVIHQTGSIDQTSGLNPDTRVPPIDWKQFYQTLTIPALTFAYHESLEDYYLLADLIVSRGGAGTLFELEFFKKQAIIIPIKAHAGNHQVEGCFLLGAVDQAFFDCQKTK